MIVQGGLPANMVHTFVFRKPGYSDAQAIWEGPGGGQVLLESPSPGNARAFTSVSDVGVVTIPMHPTSQPAERKAEVNLERVQTLRLARESDIRDALER